MSSPVLGLSACDLLQSLLQHEELCGVALLALCSLLLVVSSETLHLLSVTLLQLQLLLLLSGLQPLQFLRQGGRWCTSLLLWIREGGKCETQYAQLDSIRRLESVDETLMFLLGKKWVTVVTH